MTAPSEERLTPARRTSSAKAPSRPSNVSAEQVESIVRDLRERAKELNCLYTVEELASDPDKTLDEVFRGVIRAIPQGWQYSDACQARIIYRGDVYQTPAFAVSAWAQRAVIRSQGEAVGTLEVYYTADLPQAAEGPFLKEERKLIDIICDRLGSCITHHRLIESMQEWRATENRIREHTMRDWSVILDLLRRTDQSLLLRISRKMINHLCWSGVSEAEELLHYFGIHGQQAQQQLLMEWNRPQAVDAGPSPETLVDEVFRIAAVHLSDTEIVSCIQKWIKQDRASFLVNALENHHTSLAEVGDALHRYQHATHGEVDLSPSTRKGLRVSLIRRFLTDQLEYINVAKNYVDIGDFHDLIQTMVFPSRGHGKLGGKSAGLFLAGQIVKRHRKTSDLFDNLRTPKTWYITSDGLHDFVYCNHLEDVFTQKYKELDEVRQEFPDIVQVFKHSHFTGDIIKGLSLALDDFGEQPLIVRSSSLLEDRFGSAFSGKYKSLFIANQGTKQQRMRQLIDALAEVYASTFGPDPIAYRAERNLIDFQEGMGVMIQEVVGTRVGPYFCPTFAGVIFSQNEFRWSPRIKREDGLIRLVPGLGTRAVDRLGDDYPVLLSPGQPGLRVNATVEETVRYAPRYMDVLNLESQTFETVAVADLLRAHGDALPAAEQLVSIYDSGHLRRPLLGQVDFAHDDLVVTFEGLLAGTPFVKEIHALMELLEHEMESPVDVEFASDGQHIYLLQCRAQTPSSYSMPAQIPHDVPRDRLVFTAHRYVSNGTVPDITHMVYVVPERYMELESLQQLTRVGRAVGKLNKLLPKRQFVLIGPGRWGSRGDIKLGVQVTYSDISNTAVLIEVARKTGDYTPDLSFGTHFFQDLVEASIRYLPLYPDDEGTLFNEALLQRAPNLLASMLPEYADLADVIRVIDVPDVADGQVLRIAMNADLDEALGYLAPASTTVATHVSEEEVGKSPREQDWRWRLRMAERVASQTAAADLGVVAMYIFGSVKNATAGPGSDIDVLVHFRGTADQRQRLESWLEGWSAALSEMNYLRTGHRIDRILDAQIIDDADIARQTSYAQKIDAVTDAARPLPLE